MVASTSSGHRHSDNDNDNSLRCSYNVGVRPSSDVLGSTLYVSHHLTFSQLCLQANEETIMHPLDSGLAVGTSIAPTSRKNLQRCIKAGGRRSVVRVVGSQLVTVLKDDQKTIRRSTLSAITREFTEKSGLVDDIDVDKDDKDDEELAKQREHRSKAEKVLALLQLEQEALEREEQEDRTQNEWHLQDPTAKTELDDVESARRERVRERIRLELDDLAAAAETDEQIEGQEEEGWQLDQESITSSRWAWDEISDRGQCYREEMRILVANFKETDAKVWRQIIRRHRHSSWSSSCSDRVMDRSIRVQNPFAPLTNSQLRGGTYEILRLQARRQLQLNECIEVQSRW
ncbi:hypothetical protein GGU11DRAFT_13323 [Lentinula aff. detonsa]|uniref:Uncharacterized protein n=1 Tax=Lentinula aff. detonsa TaxID=2804958 RepID=A0AA38NI46_9AGAR|nr:hypothetical protein GGU10DRAFT_362443 [Lentinula aff. detonsa]KAJ3798212.1 hypothetical protein GGU11DRAFT_13323 [Lentinula aff. detonsa]